LNES